MHQRQSTRALGKAVYLFDPCDCSHTKLFDQLHAEMDGLTPQKREILAKDSQGPLVISIVIAFTVLSLVCVVLRFFTRIRFTRLVGTEDYMTALSMVCTRQDNDNEALLTFMSALCHCCKRLPDKTSTMGCRQSPSSHGPHFDDQ
jgi:hypothetical protein